MLIKLSCYIVIFYRMKWSNFGSDNKNNEEKKSSSIILHNNQMTDENHEYYS